MPWAFDGRSGYTDFPRALPIGFAAYYLNFALFAIPPATGCVCISPKKLCFEPLLAGLLAIAAIGYMSFGPLPAAAPGCMIFAKLIH